MEGLISHAEEASRYALKDVLNLFQGQNGGYKHFRKILPAFLSKEQNVKQHKDEKDQVRLRECQVQILPTAQDRGVVGWAW